MSKVHVVEDCAVRGALWANDLTRLPSPRTVNREYSVVQVERDPLVPHLARAMAVDETVVWRRLHRGCRTFAAWSWADEQVVSWLWVSTGQEHAPPLRRTLHFPEGDCYGWDAGTRESHRGRGLCAGVLEHAGNRMAELGSRTMWNGILDTNLPSRFAHARAGMRPVLRLLAIHEPSRPRLLTWAVDYADPRLLDRARRLLDAAGDNAVTHR